MKKKLEIEKIDIYDSISFLKEEDDIDLSVEEAIMITDFFKIISYVAIKQLLKEKYFNVL
ncbi:hypothetical protein [Chryseobacterium sp. BIGb0232]|uniref:hypothetical protein n=1 Tax=Chryseobacterium sp. BIGb0232 TaxID=2940598 RepID=UPI000F49E997|nr:hypothetical protein [Chryseobacterium sp. BIGb0232]MCS4302457.1 hypothetical protein [Chryseobacterium sp. BIGb0232]ROS18399.1 hypothetical protein EDF65_2794 [Chryseobacterium nakagawai]